MRATPVRNKHSNRGVQKSMRVWLPNSLYPVYLAIFVLVLPFGFVASLAHSVGLPAFMAQKVHGCLSDGHPVVLTAQSDGRFRIDSGQALSVWQVREELHRVFRTRDEKVVYVMGDAGATFAQVATAIDEARAERGYAAILTHALLETNPYCWYGSVRPLSR